MFAFLHRSSKATRSAKILHRVKTPYASPNTNDQAVKTHDNDKTDLSSPPDGYRSTADKIPTPYPSSPTTGYRSTADRVPTPYPSSPASGYRSTRNRAPTPFPSHRHPTAPYGPNRFYDDDEISFLDLNDGREAPESATPMPVPTRRRRRRMSSCTTASDVSARLGAPLERVAAVPAAAASQRSGASTARPTIKRALTAMGRRIGSAVGLGKR